MPKWISIGRRRNDFGLMVDFFKKRAIVRANTAFIDGMSLDEIPPGLSGFYPALVLIRREWKNIYFINEHRNWNDDDYFQYANKRLAELEITEP